MNLLNYAKNIISAELKYVDIQMYTSVVLVTKVALNIWLGFRVRVNIWFSDRVFRWMTYPDIVLHKIMI